jgi:hypothetical protein
MLLGSKEETKKMRLSINFDVHSKEFNWLVKTGYLNLAGHPALPPPKAPPNPPLKTHPSIVDFLEPLMKLTNDGWENIPTNPPYGIAPRTDNPLPPPPPLHSMPHVTSSALMAQLVQVLRK